MYFYNSDMCHQLKKKKKKKHLLGVPITFIAKSLIRWFIKIIVVLEFFNLLTH